MKFYVLLCTMLYISIIAINALSIAKIDKTVTVNELSQSVFELNTEDIISKERTRRSVISDGKCPLGYKRLSSHMLCVTCESVFKPRTDGIFVSKRTKRSAIRDGKCPIGYKTIFLSKQVLCIPCKRYTASTGKPC
ncbi:unnamed protein product, partial [Brenthis ino]